MRLDHFTIKGPMDLLDQVKSFYCDVIGFEVGYRPGFSVPGYWLYTDDIAVLHLIEGNIDESEGDSSLMDPNYMDHVAFRCSDLEALRGRLDDAGISFRESRIDDARLKQLFVMDPAGVRVEFNAVETA